MQHPHTDGSTYSKTGVWLLRGQRGKNLIDATWSCDDYVHHEWLENAVLMVLLGFEYVDPSVWGCCTRD